MGETTYKLIITVGAVVTLPETGMLGCVRRWRQVAGYRIAESGSFGAGANIWCRTGAAAQRIALALLDGDLDLINRILMREQDPDFCVDARNAEVSALIAAGRIAVRKARKSPAARRPRNVAPPVAYAEAA